jgi:hypothetical protein
MLRTVLVAAAIGLSSLSAAADELVQFTKGPKLRWAVGDKSEMVFAADGRLALQLVVKKSPGAEQAYYVVAFHTRTEAPVNFSARVADRPPQRTHFAARAEPGRPYVWGEHLPAQLETVYVMLRATK